MRARADADGSDLIVIDSGDRVEGNGLYDASDPKGKYLFDILKRQHIDIMCAGNHELYKSNTSDNEYFETEPDFKDSYLASNLDIHDHKTGELRPLAPRFKKFTTKNQGIRILAFGFMFDFKSSSPNTVVTPVEDAIKQDWFQKAIRDKDVDLFVVTSHIGLRMPESIMIFNAIRRQRWDTPIHFFGGHVHVRDYAKYDSKAFALASGRYMETIGFASVSGLSTSKDGVEVSRKNPTFGRRYIDNNLWSFYHHADKVGVGFSTKLGENVTKQIAAAREALSLDSRHGCAPRDLWLSRVGPDDDNSIHKWLRTEVFPDEFSSSKHPAAKLVITNTGAIRFDIFKGPFTRDTSYQVTPFTTGFRYIKDVKYSVASKLLDLLNSEVPVIEQLGEVLDSRLLRPHLPVALEEQAEHVLGQQWTSDDQSDKDGKPLTPGYTTNDDAGTDGDDTVHSTIPYAKIPSCIAAEVDYPKHDKKPERVDVIYNEFIEPWVLRDLARLAHPVDRNETAPWLEEDMSMTMIMTNWIEKHWPCEEDVMIDEL